MASQRMDDEEPEVDDTGSWATTGGARPLLREAGFPRWAKVLAGIVALLLATRSCRWFGCYSRVAGDARARWRERMTAERASPQARRFVATLLGPAQHRLPRGRT